MKEFLRNSSRVAAVHVIRLENGSVGSAVWNVESQMGRIWTNDMSKKQQQHQHQLQHPFERLK